MTAHFSYVKQDQETLRMSVKAIAVSMSNTQDRSASNLKEIKEIRTIVDGLTTQTKKHYHKLNDHIMKVSALYMIIWRSTETGGGTIGRTPVIGVTHNKDLKSKM